MPGEAHQEGLPNLCAAIKRQLDEFERLILSEQEPAQIREAAAAMREVCLKAARNIRKLDSRAYDAVMSELFDSK
jgi:hypothetical protein